MERSWYVNWWKLRPHCRTSKSAIWPLGNLGSSTVFVNWSKVGNQKNAPRPGIEPGPPGWKPGILTPRPSGIDFHFLYPYYELINNKWKEPWLKLERIHWKHSMDPMSIWFRWSNTIHISTRMKFNGSNWTKRNQTRKSQSQTELGMSLTFEDPHRYDHLYSRGWGSCDDVIGAFRNKLHVSKAPLIDGFISSGIWTLRALNQIQ